MRDCEVLVYDRLVVNGIDRVVVLDPMHEAGFLQRRIAIAATPADATTLALERARIFEEDLKEPAEAIVALEQIINEMDPANVAAAWREFRGEA